MPRVHILLFILPFLSFVAPRWTSPVQLFSYIEPMRISASLYFDPVTGDSHISHCNNSDGTIYYTRVDETGLFVHGPVPLTKNVRCYEQSISGPEDGQHLYIAFEARRSMKTYECSMKTLEACDDIYMLESRDGGRTWRGPVAVGNKDPVRRREPKLLPLWRGKDTKMWVGFKKELEDGKVDFCLAEYSIAKGGFAKEKVMLKNFPGMFSTNFVTLASDGVTPVLNFLYASPFSLSKQLVISRDSGETFLPAASVKAICQKNANPLHYAYGFGRYIIAVCAGDRSVYFQYSTDQGATWSSPDNFTSDRYEAISFTRLADAKDVLGTGILQIITHSVGQRLGLTIFEIGNKEKTLKFINLPELVYYLGYDNIVAIAGKHNELKARFVFTTRELEEGKNKFLVKLTSNDNLYEGENPEGKNKEEL